MLPVVFSTGSNTHGQLAHGGIEDSHRFSQCIFANGDGTSGPLPSRSKVLNIVAGANHTLLLLELEDGKRQLWGCGDGRRGQLGPNFVKDHAHRIFNLIPIDKYDHYRIKFISASWETSYVALSHLTESDILISMGSNDFGVLGVGDLPRLESIFHRVDFDHLFSSKPLLVRIQELKAGPRNVFVKLSYLHNNNGPMVEVIAGWGAARQGQLGMHVPQKTSFFSSPCLINLPDIRSFVAGSQHAIFLTSEGLICSLGSNKKQQLEGLSTVTDVCEASVTWNGTYLVRQIGESWELLASGSNSKGQLGCSPHVKPWSSALRRVDFPTDLRSCQLLSLACGSEHVLVILQRMSSAWERTKREVWGWGWNEHGNLGLDHTQDISEPTILPVGQGTSIEGQVAGIWAGCGTSWIVIDSI